MYIAELINTLKQDIEVFQLVHNKPGVLKYLYLPDFRAVLIFRLSSFLIKYRLIKPLAYLFTMLNDFLTGVWISPHVEIMPGLFLGHPRGLVINPSTKIGKYCSIMQRVTIGGPNIVIGDNVEINAGASLISNVRGNGKLTIGENVVIGAGTVVVNDIPSFSVVVGVPGKVVKSITMDENWVEFRKRRNTYFTEHNIH